MRPVQTLKPDAKGRVCLGSLAAGVSSYHLTYDDVSGKIALEPYIEVPLQEVWLFQNGEALRSVREGLKQSKAGKLQYLGSFARYTEDED